MGPGLIYWGEHGRARASHSHGHDSNSTQLPFPMSFLAVLHRGVSNAAGNGKKLAAKRSNLLAGTPAPLRGLSGLGIPMLGGGPACLLAVPLCFSLWGSDGAEVNSLLILL